MKYLKYIFLVIIGFALGYLVLKATYKEQADESSSTIAYGISRLNKMVVAEQTYANFYSHKSKAGYLGNLVTFDKNLLLKVKIKAQASYDLSKMKVEIDSANKTIHIKEIPELKIETFPDVDFFEVNQSKFNQFSKKDLNGIKKRAIEEVKKTINETNLRNEAHKQLIYNLEEVYLLAKVYHWQVVDDTEYADELRNRMKKL